jgi:hypothetical protein
MTLAEWAGMRIAGRRMARGVGERDALSYPLGWFERTDGSLAEVEDFREPADPPVGNGPSPVTRSAWSCAGR